MRLGEREKLVLSAVELQAGAPIKEIEEQTGLREHALRYTLRKLQEAGVLGPKRPVIDLNRLGFSHYTFLFSLTSETRRRKTEFLDYLLAAEPITWMFELGGDFHYGASITVRHIQRVSQFLHEASGRFGNIFFEKLFAHQLSYVYFGRRYLAGQRVKSRPIRLEIQEEVAQLDEQDQRIVRAMMMGEYSTLTQLAARLHLPLATLERRKRRLEERGIIRGYFHWIEPAVLDVQPYTLLIYMRGISPRFRDDLLRFAKKELQVVYFIECMGNWDFELGIEVFDFREVTAITQKLYDQFPEDMRTLKVVPILKHLKFKGYTPNEGSY